MSRLVPPLVAIALIAHGAAAAPVPVRLVQVLNAKHELTYAAGPASEPGRLYVVERRGTVRSFENGRIAAKPFIDLRRVVLIGGERGLLSIAFHPGYAQNRLVYAAYTARDGAVTVAELRAGALVRTLVRIPHDDSPYHNGGQLQFGRDGLLYVGVGDGGYVGPQPDPHGNSQNLDVLLGKLFALDVSQLAPEPRIVALGLRNPWRFSVDPRNGDLLIGDVGWNGVEEVDRLPAGGALVNFGWSVYEGRRERRSGGDRPELAGGTLTWPLLTYSTRIKGNCAIVGGFVAGPSVPRVAGRYVYGDYCSGRIWSVGVANGAAGKPRLEPVRVPRLTSFAVDGQGRLYAVQQSGRIYRFAR